MSSNNDALGTFFSKQTEEDKNRRQQAVDATSAEEKVYLKISGRYRMKASSYRYTKDNKVTTMPDMRITENKKALMLVVPMKVVDGTPSVPKGAMFFLNIVLSPPPDASDDKFAKTMGIAKPRLAALLGHGEIEFDEDWMRMNLLPEFESDGDIHKLVRDHKMQNEVMVEIYDDFYNNQDTLSVKSVVPAMDNDKSVSNVDKTNDGDVSEFNNLMDGKKDNAETIEAENIADEAVSETSGSTKGDDIVDVQDF